MFKVSSKLECLQSILSDLCKRKIDGQKEDSTFGLLMFLKVKVIFSDEHYSADWLTIAQTCRHELISASDSSSEPSFGELIGGDPSFSKSKLDVG